MNVAVACGGTGGHLFPGLAVAEELRRRGHEVLLIVSEKEIDTLALEGHEGFQVERLPSIGLPSLFSPAIFGFVGKFGRSLLECRKIFARFRPDAVLGMGGFTSTAPILAGRLRKQSAFIHESNAIPGKANRLNARLSTAVLVGFEECKRYFKGKRCQVTGTPVRDSLRQEVSRDDVLRALGFEAGRKTLLVMGGSQGARGINQAVPDAVGLLSGLDVQVIHLAGTADGKKVEARYGEHGVPHYVAAFHHRMHELYTLADLAIARAGASTLAEFSFFGLPAVLIPYPYAAEDHQKRNAAIFTRAGAAIMVEESALDTDLLSHSLGELLGDAGRLKRMSERCRETAQGEATVEVANAVEELSAT